MLVNRKPFCVFKKTNTTHTTKNPLSIISSRAGTRRNGHRPDLECYRIKDFKSHGKPLQRNDTNFDWENIMAVVLEGT